MKYMIVEPGPADNYGPHTPLLAYANGDPEPEIGPYSIFSIEVDSFGEPTGRFADGTRGITDTDKAYAECDDSPMCACCHAAAEKWADA